MTGGWTTEPAMTAESAKPDGAIIMPFMGARWIILV